MDVNSYIRKYIQQSNSTTQNKVDKIYFQRLQLDLSKVAQLNEILLIHKVNKLDKKVDDQVSYNVCLEEIKRLKETQEHLGVDFKYLDLVDHIQIEYEFDKEKLMEHAPIKQKQTSIDNNMKKRLHELRANHINLLN